MHPWFNILAAGGKSGASTANFCTELRLSAASGPLSGLCLAKYLCLPPAGPPHLKDCLGAHQQVMLGMSERPEDFPSCKEVRGLCSSPIPSGPPAEVCSSLALHGHTTENLHVACHSAD